MGIAYTGLVPAALNVPLIELEAGDGGVIDLYNECRLDAVIFDEKGLAFSFSRQDGSQIGVAFRGVRKLRVSQPHDWHPEEGRQIDHLLVRPDGQTPQIDFNAGGLLRVRRCGAGSRARVTAQTGVSQVAPSA